MTAAPAVPPGAFTVACPACPDLHGQAPDDDAALEVAGAHDDLHHGGIPTAHIHPTR